MRLKQTDKIIIYGAGYGGLMLYDLFIKNFCAPIHVFDISENKQGRIFHGITIRRPFWCVCDYIIISVLSRNETYNEIKQSLLHLGYNENQIISAYDIENKQLFMNQKLVLYPKQKKSVSIVNNIENIFCDAESYLVFNKYIDYLNGNRNTIFPAHSIEEQYFAYDIFTKIEEEYLVDCGGYKGDVMNIFLKNNLGNFSQYTLIEPNSCYNDFIKKNMMEYNEKKIFIKNIAISDRCERLYLTDYLLSNSVVHEKKEYYEDYIVEADTLDNIVGKDKCTFLKIDIEGYEIKALKGAKMLISLNKPIVAVAIYHKEWDLLYIYLMLKEYFGNYSFYLRSYMNFNETILYAIPDERKVI